MGFLLNPVDELICQLGELASLHDLASRRRASPALLHEVDRAIVEAREALVTLLAEDVRAEDVRHARDMIARATEIAAPLAPGVSEGL